MVRLAPHREGLALAPTSDLRPPTSDLQRRSLEDIAADLRSANANLAARIRTTYEAVARFHRSQSSARLQEDYPAGPKKGLGAKAEGLVSRLLNSAWAKTTESGQSAPRTGAMRK